jgi:hypothetical protein
MKTILRVLVLIPLLFISSCTKDSNPVDSGTPTTPSTGGKISTGQSVDLGSQTIGTSGGSFTVNKSGDPLNGFQITIPANGFTQSQSIAVSYAPITSHQLGSSINALSPLIKITCDGGYSSDQITVKIPIKLPVGSFAMGFFYDETTGELEPLPVATLDSTSITIATRHLSPSDTRLGKGLLKLTNPVWGSMFISYIAKSVLHNLPVLSSGFTPGVDDWEFPNNGSYISPKGHCAGQSATAIWYYYEHKLKGEAGLYNRYDKVKADWFWPDNPMGYRFASSVQEDMSFWSLIGASVSFWLPDVVFDSFIYSMYVTGKPQMVGVSSILEGVGHEMVVYKIDVFGGKLYVADPNFPGNTTRVIEFVPGVLLGSFKPYFTELKVGDKGYNLGWIQYHAVTSLVAWSKIAQRWTEFQNGTIGNDRFPAYSLTEIRNLTDFVDGLDTDLDSVKVISVSNACAFALPGTFNRQFMSAYDAQGTLLNTTKDQGVLTLGLRPGDNIFGMHMSGCGADTQLHYVDFKWIKVHRHMTLTIATTESNGAPVSTPGTKTKQYTFVTKSARPVPKDGKVRYDWSFGDGSAATSINNDSTVIHTFTKDGTDTINVSFSYDGTKISQVSAIATIAATPPTITSITPSVANIGDTVKVSGKNFGADKTKGAVTFSNNVAATQIINWIDTVITVKVPQGAQSGSVSVTVSGLASNAMPFTVGIVPVITSLTPSLAKVNDTISIDGSSFGTDKTRGYVQFTGALVSGTTVVSWTSTRIRVVIPSAAATGPLFVTVKGIASNQVVFTLNATPSITSISPLQVSYATPVHIVGKNFGPSQGVSSIKFGAYPPKSVVSWNDNEIVATVPELFDNDVISLTINGTTCRSSYLTTPDPQITSTNPDSAYALEPITLRGTKFGYEQGHARIIFSYVDTATVLSWSDTVITAIVPEPSRHYYGPDPIKVIAGNGRYRTYNNFIIIEDVMETLHRTQSVSISMAGTMTMYTNPTGNQSKHNSFSFSNIGWHVPITWSGTAFHFVASFANSSDSGSTTFDGTVSNDGKTLLTITGRLSGAHLNNVLVYHHTDITELIFQNVPLNIDQAYQIMVGFGVTGAAARNYVTSVKFESHSDGIMISQYISTDWTNATDIPSISVSFQ